MKKVFEVIRKYRDVLYIAAIIAGCIIISAKSSKIESLGREIEKQENNRIAMTEQITNYKDELDMANAEKHAYQLTQDELRDSIGLLTKKNKEYVSYINSHIGIQDTIVIESVIEREVETNVDSGNITLAKSETFGKSSMSLSATIPYTVDSSVLHTGDATFILSQDIFVEGWLERDKKTEETYMHLRSDYPGLVFNSGMGIVAESGREYERSMRKNFGIGVAVGPNIGMCYDFSNNRIIPSVGIGVTVGFTYTPKAFQW